MNGVRTMEGNCLCFNYMVRFWHVPAEVGEYHTQQSIASF